MDSLELGYKIEWTSQYARIISNIVPSLFNEPRNYRYAFHMALCVDRPATQMLGLQAT